MEEDKVSITALITTYARAYHAAHAAPKVFDDFLAGPFLGEPMITGFDPSTLATDLAGCGWRLEENLSPSEVEERYFAGRTDGYHAAPHIHFAQAVLERSP